MIDRALSIIVNRLNQHLATPETAPEDAAVLMDLADSSGPAPEAQDKIVVFITNITEDTLARSASRAPGIDMHTQMQRPLSLHIHFVVAANFEPAKYVRALNALSRAVQFFQAYPVFDRSNSPDMANSGIDRLSIEMESLGVDSVSQLWGVLGGRYLPSVVYRARTLSIDTQSVLDEVPAIGGLQTDTMVRKS